MYLDILIFAIIAAFLLYRLNAVLGTRHDDGQPRPDPFAGAEVSRQIPPVPVTAPLPAARKPIQQTTDFVQMVDAAANKDGRIETGLEEIAAADPQFELNRFMAGAKYAFEVVVMAYSRGDRAVLQPLLSPKLYADFDMAIKAREDAGYSMEMQIHRIKAARIIEAHLGGAMAYITIDYDVEQTSVTRDRSGTLVEGSPDRISSVEDIWTFTRDIRSADPNWILIETRAAEK